MLTKSNPITRSGGIAGMLWILAGTLCLVPRLFFTGGGLSLGIGMMSNVLASEEVARSNVDGHSVAVAVGKPTTECSATLMRGQ